MNMVLVPAVLTGYVVFVVELYAMRHSQASKLSEARETSDELQ